MYFLILHTPYIFGMFREDNSTAILFHRRLICLLYQCAEVYNLIRSSLRKELCLTSKPAKSQFFLQLKSHPRRIVVSPQSARQYEAAFRQHYDNFAAANLGEPNRFGQDCYDATWILALALNNTLTGMVLNTDV